MLNNSADIIAKQNSFGINELKYWTDNETGITALFPAFEIPVHFSEAM